jgi:hypothetical protein
MKKSDTTRELAKSAFEVLNELMWEIHGARVTGAIAIKKPEIFQIKHPRYIVRNSIGIIVLALRKFDDIWTNQIAPILLQANLPQEGIQLRKDIKEKKLRTFCNRVIAHYSKNKVSPRTPITKIEELLLKQGFTTDMDFFLWTMDVLTKIERVRDCIADEYKL